MFSPKLSGEKVSISFCARCRGQTSFSFTNLWRTWTTGKIEHSLINTNSQFRTLAAILTALHDLSQSKRSKVVPGRDQESKKTPLLSPASRANLPDNLVKRSVVWKSMPWSDSEEELHHGDVPMVELHRPATAPSLDCVDGGDHLVIRNRSFSMGEQPV